ncbi:hypothetical protein K7X08_021070 [Anisodus acutangulus]|uniref:Uncharacterized protein n=1 Tax=Anisodus acutangulus TaxID=402998 RepID=A0A9Q1RAQ3_9SOLA|nr:hypothetical protein K7X08_021070 [Anisodus acutangulus]
MDDARHALRQKEDVVAGLKRKMDEVSTFEKLFIGLCSEVGSLGIVIKKIQDAVTPMSDEDRKTFTSLVEGQEEWQSIRQSENLRMPDIVQITRKDSHLKSSMIEESTASLKVQEDSIKSSVKKDKINCCASELAPCLSVTLTMPVSLLQQQRYGLLTHIKCL